MKRADLLETFTKDVVWLFGGQVKSILLYGSTVSGEWHHRFSDYNVLIVLDRIGQPELAKLSTILPRWLKAGNPTPVLMTPADLQRGADVFPMEYLDFKAHHRILHGEDMVQGLQISHANLRHECEHELRGKSLKLRQSYAAVADQSDAIKDLLVKSWSTFAFIARHLLVLSGQPAPSQKMEALEALTKLTGGNPKVFQQIHVLREDAFAVPDMSWADLMQHYFMEVDRIVQFVDRMGLKQEMKSVA